MISMKYFAVLATVLWCMFSLNICFAQMEASPGMVKVSGKALAAGKIEANISGAIPAASALPLTIVVSSPSQASPESVSTPSQEDDQKFTVCMKNSGWCWFQDPRAIAHNGKLFIGEVAGNGSGAASVGVDDLQRKRPLGNVLVHGGVVLISTDVDSSTGKALGGKHEIFGAKVGLTDDIESIEREAVTQDSAVRNIRPIIVRDGDNRILLWNREEFRTTLTTT